MEWELFQEKNQMDLTSYRKAVASMLLCLFSHDLLILYLCMCVTD